METGSIISVLRKERDWSLTELATQSDISREMIGKYERGGAVPSIEAAKKIADAFEVSLDYLVGEGINSKFDKKTVKSLQNIEELDAGDKEYVFAMLDAFLTKNKMQAILK